MSRPNRSERLAAKGRPKRRAAKTHFFKYQLAGNPNRAEENDLKRALQESLEEQTGSLKKCCSSNVIISSTNSSDVSGSNTSSFSNESAGSFVLNAMAQKRTRSSAPASINRSTNKRAKLVVTTNGHQRTTDCDGIPAVSPPKNINVTTTSKPQSPVPRVSKAIKTYSRVKSKTDSPQQNQRQATDAIATRTSTTTNLNILPKASSTPNLNKDSRQKASNQPCVSRSTQTPSVCKSGKSSHATTSKSDANNITVSSNCGNPTPELTLGPVQDQYLKFKRESKNYAYVKMTALKVSTSKSPSSNSKSVNSKKSAPNGVIQNSSTDKNSPKVSPKLNNSNNHGNGHNSTIGQQGSARISNTSLILQKSGSTSDKRASVNNISTSAKKSPIINSTNISNHQGSKVSSNKSSADASVQNSQQLGKNNIPRHDIYITIDNEDSKNDCSLEEDDDDETIDLSKKKNQNQANVKVTKKRLLLGSWSLLGVPEERVIYLRDDEPARRLICYPAIKHVEGDVIQVKDSVLLRSGARKTDLPYIAKVCAFWEDAETGGVMMSLYWYYRPEHTEEGRKPHHLPDEIFASRHRDVDSVECIEDKCYVLTFNEYCRYRKRCKMEQVNTTWSLTDVTIPVSNESYPRRNRIPDGDVNPELVFCCRQIYDSRMKRLIKNPLINPKYGHI